MKLSKFLVVATTALSLSCSTFTAPVFAAPSAEFVEVSGSNAEREKYKVSGAEGADLDAAKKAAIGEALVFAAKRLTGSEKEKQEIQKRRGKISSLQNLAKVGKVTKTTFNGERPIIDVLIDVNVKDLRIQLETDKVISSASDMSDAVGNPTILVLPDGYKPGQKYSDAQQFVSDRIAEFLTQRKFEMVDPKAMSELQERTAAAQALDGVVTDPIAELASLVGADIYITYVAGFTAEVKSSASVKAFETTTARLIASATGESRQYASGKPRMDVIREAVSDCVPKALENISGYWHEDIKKGRKYVFSIAGNFSDRDKQKQIRKGLEELGDVKFDVKTAQKLGGTIRSKKKSDDVDEGIGDVIQDAGFKAKVILSNRSTFIYKAE